MAGLGMVLSDQENLCAFARFCDPGGKIWSLIEQSENPEVRTLVIREAMHCPSGRRVLHDKQTRKEIEEPLEPAIGIVEDPALGCSGPLWVQGGITIESADGRRYEKRNRDTGNPPAMPFWDMRIASNGRSTIEQRWLDVFSLRSVSGDTAAIWLREFPGAVKAVWFNILPVGWVGEWHPSPAPQ